MVQIQMMDHEAVDGTSDGSPSLEEYFGLVVVD